MNLGKMQITLVRRLSRSPCKLHDSYGVTEAHGVFKGNVWVKKGCSGQFEVTKKRINDMEVSNIGMIS